MRDTPARVLIEPTVRFDLLIRDAEIHDGLGSTSRGDVGILGDWIAAVGKVDGANAVRIVDAKGRMLSPGFIDLNGHADLALLRDPKLECKILQGVTTEVLSGGGVGCAPRPVPAFEPMLGSHEGDWDTVEGYLSKLRTSVNVAPLISHGAVRHAVMGMEERPATREEIKKMRALVGGGLGMSSGLSRSPMNAATPGETAMLAAEAGFLSLSLRDAEEGLDEAFEICARSRVGLEITRLSKPDYLSRIDEARDRGLDVTIDVSPYDEDAETLYQWPHSMVGSDGVHVEGQPHPALWGTFPRVLATWGMKMLPKMTSMPAARLGLKNRGVIREMAAADLVLLSGPKDRATIEEPTLPPEGIDMVVVNGIVVVEEGRHLGTTPGKVLTRG